MKLVNFQRVGCLSSVSFKINVIFEFQKRKWLNEFQFHCDSGEIEILFHAWSFVVKVWCSRGEDMSTKFQVLKGRRDLYLAQREQRLILRKLGSETEYGCYSRVERDIDIHRAKVRYWYKL